jgi:hypothetical protein
LNRNMSSIYGLIGGFGLMSLSTPSFERLILFGGWMGFIVNELIQIISSIGFYAVLYFSSVLVIHGIRSVILKKN